MNRQQTIDQKREGQFHMRIKKLLTKTMQGYVMGAFREAVAVAEQMQLEQDGVIDEVTRMRRLMKALGDPDAFNHSDEEVRGRLFVTLGQAAGKINHLEALRPHWAEGHTSDGVAAQCKTDALNQIWKILGVDNQTQAVQKLAILTQPHGTNSKGPQ